MPFAEALDAPPLVLAGDAFAGYVTNPLDAAYTSATHAVAHLCRVLGRTARSRPRTALKTPSRVTLEVSVASADEAAAAVAAGADALFLSAAPEVGGLTPTVDALHGVCRAVARATGRGGQRVPVTVLVRPRLGGCEYTAGEFDQMRRDARRLLAAGADAIAFGVLTARAGEVRVDAARCRRLVRLAHARGRTAVFHRAFDGVTDRRVGIQDLIAVGCDRVVTGGGRRLAIDGVSELAAAVGYAGWDIEVAAAGGVTPGTVGGVVRGSGSRHVLAALRRPGTDQPASAKVTLGKAAGSVGHRVTDPELVAATAAVLRRIEREDGPSGNGVADGRTTPAESDPEYETVGAGVGW
jgi:copper homeostasis protein